MSKGALIGWRGITCNEGKFVDAEDGFAYVCQQVGIKDFDESAPESEEFKEMLVEWYFSGNWIEVHRGSDVNDETAAALYRMGARAHGGADNG